MKISFSKYNGAGNDFIVIDNRYNKLSLTKSQIFKLCNRNVGIGADGWFGKGTETKVKAVQKALGIDETGQLDLHTWKYTFAEKKER